jgi:hypothetical protein
VWEGANVLKVVPQHLCPPIEKVGCAIYQSVMSTVREDKLTRIKSLNPRALSYQLDYHINWWTLEKTLDYHRIWWNHTLIENGHNRRPHLTYLKDIDMAMQSLY